MPAKTFKPRYKDPLQPDFFAREGELDEREREIMLREEQLQRDAEYAQTTVLTVEQRSAWLSGVVLDSAVEMKDRLKAMDLLCRKEGDFVLKVQPIAEDTSLSKGEREAVIKAALASRGVTLDAIDWKNDD